MTFLQFLITHRIKIESEIFQISNISESRKMSTDIVVTLESLGIQDCKILFAYLRYDELKSEPTVSSLCNAVAEALRSATGGTDQTEGPRLLEDKRDVTNENQSHEQPHDDDDRRLSANQAPSGLPMKSLSREIKHIILDNALRLVTYCLVFVFGAALLLYVQSGIERESKLIDSLNSQFISEQISYQSKNIERIDSFQGLLDKYALSLESVLNECVHRSSSDATCSKVLQEGGLLSKFSELGVVVGLETAIFEGHIIGLFPKVPDGGWKRRNCAGSATSIQQVITSEKDHLVRQLLTDLNKIRVNFCKGRKQIRELQGCILVLQSGATPSGCSLDQTNEENNIPRQQFANKTAEEYLGLLYDTSAKYRHLMGHRSYQVSKILVERSLDHTLSTGDEAKQN